MSLPPRAERWLTWVLLATAGVIAVAQAVFYFTRTVDDLFISLRYAEHFATGQGLVYNRSQRVEGFSSPLWVLLQAGALVLGIEGVTATKALSGASLVWLGALTFRYARCVLGVAPPIAALTVAALAANSYLMAWTWLGLETPLYLALLVAWPLALHALDERPSTAHTLQAIAAGVALATVRPEAPLLLVMLLASALSAPRATPRQTHIRRLASVALGVGLVLLLLLGARFAYYSDLLPHTYYAKRGAGFDLTKLRPLWAMGAHRAEVLALIAGSVGAGWLAVRRRADALLVGLSNAAFVAAVREDWMPNLRHLLPTWLFATLAGGALVSRLWGAANSSLLEVRRGVRWARHGAHLMALCLVLIVAWASIHQLKIDSRFSAKEFRSHGRGRIWVRPKTSSSWRDAALALRRIPPPHIRAMPVNRLGMITQLFRVLEHAPEDEGDEWYVGRDIGRLGYYSPINVFDTDGLFTSEVATSRSWISERRVSTALAQRALGLEPLAGEVYEAWPAALAPHLSLDQYAVVTGNARYPIAFVRRGAKPPARLVLRRYARVARKLPQSYYLSTLYGECVGAAFEKRHAFVRLLASR